MKIAEKVRNLRTHGLEEGVSTRLLVYAGPAHPATASSPSPPARPPSASRSPTTWRCSARSSRSSRPSSSRGRRSARHDLRPRRGQRGHVRRPRDAGLRPRGQRQAYLRMVEEISDLKYQLGVEVARQLPRLLAEHDPERVARYLGQVRQEVAATGWKSGVEVAKQLPDLYDAPDETPGRAYVEIVSQATTGPPGGHRDGPAGHRARRPRARAPRDGAQGQARPGAAHPAGRPRPARREAAQARRRAGRRPAADPRPAAPALPAPLPRPGAPGGRGRSRGLARGGRHPARPPQRRAGLPRGRGRVGRPRPRGARAQQGGRARLLPPRAPSTPCRCSRSSRRASR